MKSENMVVKLFPVLPAFFAMGFVDLVGIASNYAKRDFALTDTWANMFPSMVFFWFLVGAVPTGMLMNKIGRRKTVLAGLFVTFMALLLPSFAYTLPVMVVSFCLLGIGNTIMQVSLNPLVSNLIKDEKLSGALTFGQFVKAIASFVAPILAAWGAVRFGKWQVLFPVFAVVSVLAVVLLARDKGQALELCRLLRVAEKSADCAVLFGDYVPCRH